MKKLKVVLLGTLMLIGMALAAAPIVASAQRNLANPIAPAISVDATAPMLIACPELPCGCPDC